MNFFNCKCKFNNLFTIHLPPPYSSLCNRRTTRFSVRFSSETTHRVKLAESLQYETLKLLEWPAVCQQLSAFTSTSMGFAAAQSAQIPVGKTPDESSKLLSQTSAAVAVPRPLDFSGIEDVSAIVDASVAGGILSIRELFSVKRTLAAARFLLHQLEEIDFSERFILGRCCRTTSEILLTVIWISYNLHYFHAMKINNETQDLDGREAALIAKETHEIQQEVRTVKNEIQTIVQRFESQLRNVSAEEINTLVKKAEAAIALIVEAHQPSKDSLVREIGQSLYKPQVGEQVYVKAFGNKLATVVEEPGDDDTIFVQYGKIRVRVGRSSIRPIPPDASSSAANLKTQVQRIRSLRDLGSLSEASKNQQDSYGPVLRTSKNTVDLHGLRVEDASHQLNMAIDSRAPNSVIFVIHGMGTGVVKESALKLLRDHPRVVKFEQESPMNYGCTVAYIK